MDSKVYVNGALAGEWKYGYSAFMFDITDLVKDGENIITVRVDHHSPNSGGIQERAFSERFGFAKALRYVSAMTAFISPRQSRRTAGR